MPSWQPVVNARREAIDQMKNRRTTAVRNGNVVVAELANMTDKKHATAVGSHFWTQSHQSHAMKDLKIVRQKPNIAALNTAIIKVKKQELNPLVPGMRKTRAR